MRQLTILAAFALLFGCSDGGGSDFPAAGGSADDAGFAQSDAAVTFPDGGGPTTGTSKPTLIYAHSDGELFSMDPATQKITDIGPFDAGNGASPTITDLAINVDGEIWVNSEFAIYKAKLPIGTGPVQLTKVTNIAVKTGQRFYALAFTPAGVLGASSSPATTRANSTPSSRTAPPPIWAPSAPTRRPTPTNCPAIWSFTCRTARRAAWPRCASAIPTCRAARPSTTCSSRWTSRP